MALVLHECSSGLTVPLVQHTTVGVWTLSIAIWYAAAISFASAARQTFIFGMDRRLSSIMTHDSIGLGEDGPTHQPV